MKLTKVEKVVLVGILFGVSLMIGSTCVLLHYIQNGKVEEAITQVGISVKHVVQDIREAE